MAEQRILAEIRGYDEFTAALRAWIEELGTNYECIGELAGLQSGYLAKMIASTPIRSFSRMSLGAVLGALCLRLRLEVDTERLEQMRSLYVPRSSMGRHAVSAMHPQGNAVKPRFSMFRGNPELSRLLHQRWMVMSSPRRRRRIARAAARERWANRRNGAAESGAPGRA